MPTPSDRLGLDKYSAGERDWSHDDLVDAVDELAIQRGPVADRPASGDFDDELFYATDQNVLWGWDATASDWTIRGGTGSSEQPLDAVHTDSLANIADHVVGPTDNAKDIFNTQLAAGDTVWLGPGTHEYKNIQPTVDNVTVYGSKNAVLLLAGDTDTSPASNAEKDNLFILDGVSGWRFHGVTFDGNSESLTAYDQNTEDALNALAIVNASDVVLDGCTIRNTRQNGVRLFGGEDITVTDCYFESNRTHYLAYGSTWLSKTNGQPPTDIAVTDSTFVGNVPDMTAGNPYAIYFSGATADGTVSDCLIRGAGELSRGINLNNTYRNTVTGCVIDGVTARGIALAAGATGNTILGNTLNTPNARAIYGETGANDDNVLMANTVEGSSAHGIDVRDGTGWVILGNQVSAPAQRGFNTQTAGAGVFAYNGIYGPGSGGTANRAISINDGTWFVGPNVIDDSNATLNVFAGVEAAATDCRLYPHIILSGPTGIADSGTRTRRNGMGAESAAATTPTAANWDVGDTVDFTDTDTADGTDSSGVYTLLKDGTWAQIA